jgi:hypothetical protein
MTAPLHPAEADDYADLLTLIEDWLLHASDETLAELAEFAPRTLRPDAIIAELGRVSVRLRQLAEATP